MIKAGTPRERVAEILQASGVRDGDMLVYLSPFTDRYSTTWLGQHDVVKGFLSDLNYYYAIRIDKDRPHRIELIEPPEKTLEEKMVDKVTVVFGKHIDFYTREVMGTCAKVAEEHFGGKAK